jgi:predicted GNAT family acetyltransferase
MTQTPGQTLAITFTLEASGDRGHYRAHVEGKPDTGELSFKRIGENRIRVDHVGVPDTLRGTGVGVALARHVVAEARAKGFTIYPQCPFLVSQAQKNPDWSDVIETV